MLVSWIWPEGIYSCEIFGSHHRTIFHIFGCGTIVDTLPSGSIVLEEYLALIGNVENPQDLTPKNALVCHPMDLLFVV